MKEVAKFVLAIAAILGIVAGILRATKVDEIVVHDDRMAPSILAGERVLLWRGSDIDKGDIVVCPNPTRPTEYVMGRVIALTGAEVSSDRRGLLVDGRPLDRNSKGEARFPDQLAQGPIAVRWGTRVSYSEEHLFMLRTNYVYAIRPTRVAAGKAYLFADYESAPGVDSRSYGQVDVATCIGEVFMRLAPSETNTLTEEPFDHGYLDIID